MVGLITAVIHQILLQKFNHDLTALARVIGESTLGAAKGATYPAVQAQVAEIWPTWKTYTMFILKLPFGHFAQSSILLGIVDSLVWGAGFAWQDRRVGKRLGEAPYA